MLYDRDKEQRTSFPEYVTQRATEQAVPMRADQCVTVHEDTPCLIRHISRSLYGPEHLTAIVNPHTSLFQLHATLPALQLGLK